MLSFTVPSRALAASVVLLGALTGCGGGGGGSSSSSATPSRSAAPSSSPASPSSSPSKSAGATITIQDFRFTPAHLTVAPGTRVTVTNKDSTTHTVTAKDKKKGFDTGEIGGGTTVMFTAPSTAGSYPYTCTIHPFMKASLTVK